jgi:hypothetical protein
VIWHPPPAAVAVVAFPAAQAALAVLRAPLIVWTLVTDAMLQSAAR